MNEYDRLYRQAQRYKELYPKGTRNKPCKQRKIKLRFFHAF